MLNFGETSVIKQSVDTERKENNSLSSDKTKPRKTIVTINKSSPPIRGNNKLIKQGKYSFVVEEIAIDKGCNLDGVGELLGGDNSNERYRVHCYKQQVMNFVCEWGNCKVNIDN